MWRKLGLFAVAVLLLLPGTSVVLGGEVRLLEAMSPVCVACRQMEPALARLAATGVEIQRIDITLHRKWAQHANIELLPTFIAYKDNAEVGRIVGLCSYEELRQFAAAARLRPSTAKVRVVLIGRRLHIEINDRRSLEPIRRSGIAIQWTMRRAATTARRTLRAARNTIEAIVPGAPPVLREHRNHGKRAMPR